MKQKKVLAIIIILAIIFYYTSQVEMNETYTLDTKNHYTLTGSIAKIIEEGTVKQENHYSRFYLLLKEIEQGTLLSPEDLLTKYNITIRNTRINSDELTARVYWRYQDFNEEGLYTGGFNALGETKKLIIEVLEVNSGYVTKGDVVTKFKQNCPINYDFVEYDNEFISCSAQIDKLSYYIDETKSIRVIRGAFFDRSFIVDQKLYGYQHSELNSLQFTYRSARVLPVTTIRLLDDDKMIITWGSNAFYITRDFHYNRNQFNIDFPEWIDDPEQVFGSPTAAYFHQLGEYSLDQSNANNLKYTIREAREINGINILNSFSKASSEVIYRPIDEGYQLVDSPLVLGTFNFADATSLSIVEHWIYDVYPYLIWGNANTDRSSIKERFIWDAASWPLSGGSHLRYLRGENLYEDEASFISNHLKVDGLEAELALEVIIRFYN